MPVIKGLSHRDAVESGLCGMCSIQSLDDGLRHLFIFPVATVIGKGPDAGKDWGQEEKGATEDEMVGGHRRLNGSEFEQTLGDSEGQGSPGCCSPCKELDMPVQQWQQLIWRICRLGVPLESHHSVLYSTYAYWAGVIHYDLREHRSSPALKLWLALSHITSSKILVDTNMSTFSNSCWRITEREREREREREKSSKVTLPVNNQHF